jgi:hypothetical protein
MLTTLTTILYLNYIIKGLQCSKCLFFDYYKHTTLLPYFIICSKIVGVVSYNIIMFE